MGAPDEIKTAEKRPAKPRESFFDSVYVDIVGGIATLFSGFIAARHTTNKTFYQNVKINPDIAAEIGKSRAAHKGILERVKNAVDRLLKRKTLFEETATQNKVHESKMEKILKEEYGVETVIDKFRLLRPHQKSEVVMMTGATLAVALGAVATIASNRRVSLRQEELERRLDGEQGPQR